MAVLHLTTEQIVDLIRQLAPEEKRAALLLLADNGQAGRVQRQQLAETQLRRLCAERGQDWDALSPDDREAFIDDLIHEDRPCAG